MSIDWTKPILWDGKPARVLATDIVGLRPIAIAVIESGEEHIYRCTETGTVAHAQRVTNAPERVERWANVYGSSALCPIGEACATRKRADLVADDGRAALVRYTFEGDKLVDVAIVPLEPAS